MYTTDTFIIVVLETKTNFESKVYKSLLYQKRDMMLFLDPFLEEIFFYDHLHLFKQQKTNSLSVAMFRWQII
jgi:hypothetical protein